VVAFRVVGMAGRVRAPPKAFTPKTVEDVHKFAEWITSVEEATRMTAVEMKKTFLDVFQPWILDANPFGTRDFMQAIEFRNIDDMRIAFHSAKGNAVLLCLNDARDIANMGERTVLTMAQSSNNTPTPEQRQEIDAGWKVAMAKAKELAICMQAEAHWRMPFIKRLPGEGVGTAVPGKYVR